VSTRSDPVDERRIDFLHGRLNSWQGGNDRLRDFCSARVPAGVDECRNGRGDQCAPLDLAQADVLVASQHDPVLAACNRQPFDIADIVAKAFSMT